jgi:hypothetical protein
MSDDKKLLDCLKGMSDSCLMPIQQFFSYIMARTNFQRDDDEVSFALEQHA